MTSWPLEDPAPDEQLPSDIAFTFWLLEQQSEEVERDLESSLNWVEKHGVQNLRSRALRKHPQREEPPQSTD